MFRCAILVKEGIFCDLLKLYVLFFVWCVLWMIDCVECLIVNGRRRESEQWRGVALFGGIRRAEINGRQLARFINYVEEMCGKPFQMA